ncbi:DUF6783 domain-containing protein [Blautia segnis]|uniref:DUF6783 domain-containing protein n=1 Tax=Blautia segnis TaxID=2763030 RepID=UPI0038CC18AE
MALRRILAKWGVQIAGMIFQTRSKQVISGASLAVSSPERCTDLRGITGVQRRPP